MDFFSACRHGLAPGLRQLIGRGRVLAGLVLGGCIALQAQADPNDVHEALKGKFAGALRVMDKDFRGDVKTAHRGEELVVVVKVTGCAPNASKNCDVDGDLKLLGPGAKTVLDLPSKPLWQKEVPPPGELMTALVMGMTFTPEDPLGLYKVNIMVRDKVSGQQVEMAVLFDLKDK